VHQLTDHRASFPVLTRTAQGDADALGQLFGEYAGMVHRVALRLTMSADDADDVVQDVFVGLPEALRRYSEQGTFESWLRTLAVRVALMRMRAARARATASDAAGRATRIELNVDPHSDRLSLAAALGRLEEDYRVVFVLKVVEGYSHDEIATQLGIRRGTSEVRLYRAIRQLRTLLG
jgi:RNA polymerase sigma-70 factor, ECF subfamily